MPAPCRVGLRQGRGWWGQCTCTCPPRGPILNSCATRCPSLDFPPNLRGREEKATNCSCSSLSNRVSKITDDILPLRPSHQRKALRLWCRAQREFPRALPAMALAFPIDDIVADFLVVSDPAGEPWPYCRAVKLKLIHFAFALHPDDDITFEMLECLHSPACHCFFQLRVGKWLALLRRL